MANCGPPRVKSRLDVSSLMNVDGFFLSFIQLAVVWRNNVGSQNADIRSRAQVSRKNTEKKFSTFARALEIQTLFSSLQSQSTCCHCYAESCQHNAVNTVHTFFTRDAGPREKRDESVGKASDNKLIFNFSFSATAQATASRRQRAFTCVARSVLLSQ